MKILPILLNQLRNLENNYEVETMETRANEFDVRVGKIQMLKAIELSVGESVLEVGCGIGQFTPMLYDGFKRVVGIDLDPENIEIAKKTFCSPNHSFLVANAEKFSIDEKFDTILVAMILEHVDDPVAVLRNARDLLKDNGRIIIQTPNANSFNRQLAKYMGLIEDLHEVPEEQVVKYGHRRVYDLELLVKDIKLAGLKIIQQGGLVFKPFTNQQMQTIIDGKDEDWKERFLSALAKLGEWFPKECTIIYVVAVK